MPFILEPGRQRQFEVSQSYVMRASHKQIQQNKWPLAARQALESKSSPEVGEKKKVELIVYGLFIGLVAETGPRMRSFWLRFVNSLSESQVEAMQGPNVLRMSPRQGGKTCLPAVHLGEKSRFIFHLSTVNLDYLLATISPGQYCQPCRYCLA